MKKNKVILLAIIFLILQGSNPFHIKKFIQNHKKPIFSIIILKGIIVYATKDKIKKHFQINQLKREKELRVVKSFLGYRLKFFHINSLTEKAFIEKTWFDENDFNDKIFFNPFLTNRKELLKILWRDKRLLANNSIDIKNYTKEKAPIILLTINNNFTITTENDEKIDVDILANFLAGYTYCLQCNKLMYFAQEKEIESLLEQCKANIKNVELHKKNLIILNFSLNKETPVPLLPLLSMTQSHWKENKCLRKKSLSQKKKSLSKR